MQTRIKKLETESNKNQETKELDITLMNFAYVLVSHPSPYPIK
jgi:hypothetical protein